ncbi:hypothetical protein [Flaviflagellibacter deserti]|jgi:hypothetical protein|uniref:Uncharacterized protein n=1 Tax=Flaviflagellibacter deserti TaxID=2267266 RepID=A0ABV9Z124_9HYPH
MAYIVTRMEVEGPSVIAISSTVSRYDSLWQAQNHAELLARSHSTFKFDQERACWQGHDRDGRTFRYMADRPVIRRT